MAAVDMDDMFKALAKFKPRCTMFNTRAGCQKERSCKNRHCNGGGRPDEPTKAATSPYYMDIRADENANPVLVPRTPFTDALNRHFEENRTAFFRQAGRQAACASEIGIGLLSCMGLL
jgi:hypothetical protein